MLIIRRVYFFTLFFILSLFYTSTSLAASRGPVSSSEELLALLASAHSGDVITIRGDLVCSEDFPLSSSVPVRITSAHGESASLHNARVQNAQISFSNIALSDSIHIDGTSHVQFLKGVHITGKKGQSAVSFSGNGTLIIDRETTIIGGEEAPGVSLHHSGGELYASFEGSIAGGNGYTGGPGLIVSPLREAGVLMISGTIRGGEGSVLGGHALDLYDLSRNAFVTISGNLCGGSGSIGGDGIQLVSISDSVCVGIFGKVKGGSGSSYGGDAIMLMNASGTSVITLSGEFSGGDALNPKASPGIALQMVGDATTVHTHVNDCLLQDGLTISSIANPVVRVTPLPRIISSSDSIDALEAIPSTPVPSPFSDATASEEIPSI